jgi:uncharacterized protein (UPF0548 family)
MTRAGGIVFGRPSTARLESMLDAARASDLTYDHVGSTLDAATDRRVHREHLVLGRGTQCFDDAVTGLRAWACHDGIRATVHPPDAALEVGESVLIVLPAGPFAIVVPDRIVAAVDEADRFGFAYGTLDGHQERGEESFLIRRHDDDTVVATIAVDAGPATAAARLGAPLVLLFQRAALRRYLRALREHVGRARP